ncbi:secreted RxLR effector protein 161-like [Nicotiana sylvestris]|uniref:secreted RxLR effector protein 161-like n=1 Tax=Nicotiana sylvestris TaxID=4096 RepID=UPI00388C9729
MSALHMSGTWELVPLPSGKSTVGCHWVYVVKVVPDGQFMDSPYDSHWDAVVHIFLVHKISSGKSLLFEDRGHEQIVGYLDADWAGSSSDRHFMSVYCLLVRGNLVSWKSKK